MTSFPNAIQDAAHEFMPHGLWLFFILGGAMVAVISTLNAQLLWGSKSMVAACDDGWLPKWLGTVNRHFGTPHILLTILFIMGLLPAVTGLAIDAIGSAASTFAQIIFAVIVCASLRLRYVRPDLYQASPFKLNKKLHWVLSVVAIPVCLYQAYLLAVDFSAPVWIAAITWMALGVALFLSATQTPNVRWWRVTLLKTVPERIKRFRSHTTYCTQIPDTSLPYSLR